MRFDIITIFPDFFDSFSKEAIFSRALKNKKIKLKVHNLRRWTTDRHQTVDGKPFGGGVGMVLKIEPIYKALKSIVKKGNKSRVILFSPRGKTFDQKMAQRLSKYDQLIMISGRYEGVDERVAKYMAGEVISIGDFVMSGGEVPAMVVMETISRLIPGVIGKQESVEKFDHAQYTRPEEFKPRQEARSKKQKLWRVPKVLLSGNHKKIAEWRKKHAKALQSGL